MKVWIFSVLHGKFPLRKKHAAATLKRDLRYRTKAPLNLHLKKRELVKNDRLHLERSSGINEEKEGLHVPLYPPVLLGNQSSS